MVPICSRAMPAARTASRIAVASFALSAPASAAVRPFVCTPTYTRARSGVIFVSPPPVTSMDGGAGGTGAFCAASGPAISALKSSDDVFDGRRVLIMDSSSRVVNDAVSVWHDCQEMRRHLGVAQERHSLLAKIPRDRVDRAEVSPCDANGCATLTLLAEIGADRSIPRRRVSAPAQRRYGFSAILHPTQH